MCDICSQGCGETKGIFRCYNCYLGVSFDDENSNSLGKFLDERKYYGETTVLATPVDESNGSENIEEEQDIVVSEVVDTSNDSATKEVFDSGVLEQPKCLNKKMGKNVVVSVYLEKYSPNQSFKREISQHI